MPSWDPSTALSSSPHAHLLVSLWHSWDWTETNKTSFWQNAYGCAGLPVQSERAAGNNPKLRRVLRTGEIDTQWFYTIFTLMIESSLTFVKKCKYFTVNESIKKPSNWIVIRQQKADAHRLYLKLPLHYLMRLQQFNHQNCYSTAEDPVLHEAASSQLRFLH